MLLKTGISACIQHKITDRNKCGSHFKRNKYKEINRSRNKEIKKNIRRLRQEVDVYDNTEVKQVFIG